MDQSFLAKLEGADKSKVSQFVEVCHGHHHHHHGHHPHHRHHHQYRHCLLLGSNDDGLIRPGGPCQQIHLLIDTRARNSQQAGKKITKMEISQWDSVLSCPEQLNR